MLPSWRVSPGPCSLGAEVRCDAMYMLHRSGMTQVSLSLSLLLSTDAVSSESSRDRSSSTISSSSSGSSISSSDSGRVIEISVRKQLAEQSLSCLRMHGFTRPDIYRMLEKGPWVLAFDISGVLPRLCANIKVMDASSCVACMSH